MVTDLRGKIVVITGASSGFGRGAAVAFARAGASVALGVGGREEILQVEAACASAGGEALSKEIDVGDPIDVAELGRETVDRFGRIDVWINNAGAGTVGRFEVVPLEDHVQVIDTTLLGTVYGSYVALREFHRQKSGTLINLASVIGKIPAPFYASCAAAKHGVVGLSAALRLELEEEGDAARDIHVCTILPDVHDTAFLRHGAGDRGPILEPPTARDPRPVVEAILDAAREPRDEVVVASAGKRTVRASRASRSLAAEVPA